MSGRSALPVIVLWVVAMMSSISMVQGGKGKCLRADVPAPVVFPDGTVHPAGPLTLCVANYSPVASYHKVEVNGMPLGLLFSQRRVAEAQPGTEPVVLFRKTESGELKLLGYVWLAGKQASAYVLQGEPWDARGQRRIPARETPLPPPDEASAAVGH